MISKSVTETPFARNWSRICDPMKPEPPTTPTFMTTFAPERRVHNELRDQSYPSKLEGIRVGRKGPLLCPTSREWGFASHETRVAGDKGFRRPHHSATRCIHV